jgi:nicotinamidase-related amidase
MMYDARDTGLLLVDPYNDFLSEGGQLWPQVRAIAEQRQVLSNLRSIVRAARSAGIRVFIVPHHRAAPGDYPHWKQRTPLQASRVECRSFARDGWGGQWHPDLAPGAYDIVVQEHWGSSGFANTDLDLRLKQDGLRRLILVGMMANTCIEATGRHAAEIGYDVTLVTDATAAFSEAAMVAAHEINGPTYANAILTTAELLAALAEE